MNQHLTEQASGDIRVAMVTGDPEYAIAASRLLALRGYVVDHLGSAGDFYQHLFSCRCDLAVIDVELPDQSGLVLAEYVRKNTDARIIMLTSATQPESRLAAYGSGADVCLVKPVDEQELAALIGNIFSRLAASAQALAERQQSAPEPGLDDNVRAWRLLRNEWSLQTPDGEMIALTAKEFDFMLSLVLQSSAIVTRQYILKILGYQPNDQGNRALESLIYRLRRKTEPFGSGFPVKTYRGIGYCLATPVQIT